MKTFLEHLMQEKGCTVTEKKEELYPILSEHVWVMLSTELVFSFMS